jgi:hypothetical protein
MLAFARCEAAFWQVSGNLRTFLQGQYMAVYAYQNRICFDWVNPVGQGPEGARDMFGGYNWPLWATAVLALAFLFYAPVALCRRGEDQRL